MNREATYQELFDIVADPFEAIDLKQDHPGLVAELLRKVEDWKATLPAMPTGDVFSAERLE